MIKAVRKMSGMLLGWALVLTVASLFPSNASALSQFSRRYGVSCTTCHTAFPRLNDFGEKFKLNGFQMPDTQDGDDKAQAIGDHLTIQNIGDLFGVRISITPLAVKTDDVTINNSKRTSANVGKADWLQFFTAGSLFKNVSLLVETEVADSSVKNNWFYLGFHNLMGTKNGALNARVGRIPESDFHVASGRLRMIPTIDVEVWKNYLSAGGAAGNEDQVPLSSAQPGAEVFGLAGPIIYSVGITNGKNSTDVNLDKNYFTTIGLRKNDGPWAGSQLSVYGLKGTDTKNASTALVRDNFYRLSPGVNLRHGSADFILAYVYGNDDNWTLAGSNHIESVGRGITSQLGYTVNAKWWGGLQYDQMDSANPAARELRYEKFTPSLWYFPRENMRVGLTVRLDMEPVSSEYLHTTKSNEYLFHIRAMF